MLLSEFRGGMQYLLYSQGRIKKKVKYRIQKRLVEEFYLCFNEQVGFSHFETEERDYFC